MNLNIKLLYLKNDYLFVCNDYSNNVRNCTHSPSPRGQAAREAALARLVVGDDQLVQQLARVRREGDPAPRPAALPGALPRALRHGMRQRYASSGLETKN